jgi:DNA polymerase (family 10)
MVEAARQKGYKYICITDHSPYVGIANGLTPARLARQIEKVRRFSEKLKDITVLVGAEVDILADGELDYDDKVLAELDFVIGSIHSRMSGDSDTITKRVLKAMDNRYLHCIGHPTGRLLGEREPMNIDMGAVIMHAAKTQTAIEVSSNPYRLDLKDVHVKMAVEAGVKLVINTDAHQLQNLDYMPFGVATAARGWATKNDVVNTMTLAKLKNWLTTRRRK